MKILYLPYGHDFQERLAAHWANLNSMKWMLWNDGVNQLINWRMCKKQQMGWSRSGAQYLLHVEKRRPSTGDSNGIPGQIHQNRWLKLAGEGSQMTAQHLRGLETTRRYATLVAILLETKATLIDRTLDLHDRMIGALFNRAKHRHAEEFQQSGKAIHDKVWLYWRIGEALLEAK